MLHVPNPMYHVIAPFSSPGGGPLLPSRFPQSHIELALSLQPPLPYKSRLFVNTAQQSKRKLQTAMAEQADLSPVSCMLNRPFSHLWGSQYMPLYSQLMHLPCLSEAGMGGKQMDNQPREAREERRIPQGWP